MRYVMKIVAVLLLLMSRQALALDLGIPVACDYGEDCFIESYFDHDKKEESFADHTCGKLSDDGHQSTDFKLRNQEQMVSGVNVLAGDSGVIYSVRDGMSDISVDLIGEEAVRGRECGNGIVIEHKRGYVTQYCHLKQGSITVKKGEEVEKGQVIGQVGLSGVTSFPYLEFTVRLNGKPVDPFTGDDPVSGETVVSCDSLDIYPLWDKQTEKRLKYIATALLSHGFSDRVPHAQGAREGKFSRTEIKNDTKLIVYWVDIFGAIEGDELRMGIFDPEGKQILEESREFATSRRHVFQFVGQKPTEERWPLGEYVGRVDLLRRDSDARESVISSTTTFEMVDAAAVEKKEAESESTSSPEDLPIEENLEEKLP